MAKKPITFSRSDLEIQFSKIGGVEGKKKLAEYAQKNFGIKLNRTKTIPNMLNDLEEHVNAQFKAAQDSVGDAEEQIDMDIRVDLSDAVELNPDDMDSDEDDDDATPVEELKATGQYEEHPTLVQEIFEPVAKPEPTPEEPAPLVAPGEIRSIKDIPVEDQNIIREGLESGAIVVGSPVAPIDTGFTLSFPADYKPKYKLIGPEGRAFVNVPYWIHDWMQGRNWKLDIAECPHDKEMLKSLAFYIERDGSVAIRESRNSKFIVIS